MPYSARYKGANFDVAVIYTLDNYVSVEGTLGDVYYTKSGYFIPENSVSLTSGSSPESENLLKYNQNAAKD